MSPARKHRDRFAALVAAGELPTPVDTSSEGGQQPAPTNALVYEGPMTPARAHRLRAAGEEAVAASNADVAIAASEMHPAPSGDQIVGLRLVEDLRRLADIKSIEKKIATKREMLPEYAPYIEGVLAAATDGNLPTGDIVPTIMIWRIDVGDFAGALPLIELVIAGELPLPSRYERDAPTLIVEQIAKAAIEVQLKGESFDIALLDHIAELTADCDMHDQVRAKLEKAIGTELLAVADKMEAGADGHVDAYRAALAMHERARAHDDRVGVKDKIKRAEKAIAAITAPDQDNPPAPPPTA